MFAQTGKDEYDASVKAEEKAAYATGSVFQGLRADLEGCVESLRMSLITDPFFQQDWFCSCVYCAHSLRLASFFGRTHSL
jgi:hypothetical protein